jgi:tetratricopeptide (TPR) repeat protein
VQYLALAGKQALGRSAFAEAQAQLQQGLDLIKLLPESSGRDAKELELASTLAQVLLVIRGFAPETRAAAARAAALAEKSGNLAQLVMHASVLWRSLFYSGDYSNSIPLAGRILYLAEREAGPASLGLACRAQLDLSFVTGNLARVENYFERLSGCLEAPGFRQVPGAAIGAIFNAAIGALIQGHADRAHDRIAQALAVARDSKNPYELAAAAGFFDSFLSYLLREPQRAEAAATRGVAPCEEHGFAVIKAWCLTAMGWARAQLGRPGEGVSIIREGLDGLAEVGAKLGITDWFTRLAEAQALDGKIEDALGTLEDALEALQEEVVFRPNILTRRGELRLKQGHSRSAEADFREAVTLAQKMNGRLWELRATISLARLLRETNRHDEARNMLGEIYNWFTEGLDTPDLKDAKALLDELSKHKG